MVWIEITSSFLPSPPLPSSTFQTFSLLFPLLPTPSRQMIFILQQGIFGSKPTARQFASKPLKCYSIILIRIPRRSFSIPYSFSTNWRFYSFDGIKWKFPNNLKIQPGKRSVHLPVHRTLKTPIDSVWTRSVGFIGPSRLCEGAAEFGFSTTTSFPLLGMEPQRLCSEARTTTHRTFHPNVKLYFFRPFF